MDSLAIRRRSTIRIAAHTAASRLRVEIAVSGAAFTAQVATPCFATFRTRLRASTETGGNLAFGSASKRYVER